MKKGFTFTVPAVLAAVLIVCFGAAICAWAADETADPGESSRKYSLVLSASSFVYNGAAQCPTVKVVNNDNGKSVSRANYSVAYENEKSKNAGSYSVTVSFTAEAYAQYPDMSASYEITALSLKSNAAVSLQYTQLTYTGNARKPAATVTVGGKKLTAGTDYTAVYSNNTNPGRATVKITGINNYSGSVSKTFIIVPAKVTGVKCKARAQTSVTLTWGKSTGASGYKIYQYSSKEKKYKRIKTIKSGATTSYKVASLTNSTKYRFVVQAYVTVGSKNYTGSKSASFQTYTAVAKYSGTIKVSRTSGAKKMTVKYTAAKHGSGCQIAYSYDSQFKKGVKYVSVKGLSAKSQTISSLSTAKSYYVKIRLYVETADGKKHYGKWSSAVRDFSYKSNCNLSISKSSSSTKMTVHYSKSPYGDGYEIAYSTDKNFKSGVKKIYKKGRSATAATITGLSKAKGYYVRVRPYTNVGSRKVYGTYSKMVSTGYNFVYATYKTAYVNNANRTNNLKIASAAINGTVIQPGGTFDFNAIVGRRTEAKGYKKAPVFSGGSVVSGVGGGICQVASTVFNTALLSNFTIVERHQHSQRVSYVPLGRDAAIYYGSQDLKWKNNSKYSVKIKMTVKDGYITCTLLTESQVSPPSVSLKVAQSGSTFTLKRYVNGKCNYTAKSKY